MAKKADGVVDPVPDTQAGARYAYNVVLNIRDGVDTLEKGVTFITVIGPADLLDSQVKAAFVADAVAKALELGHVVALNQVLLTGVPIRGA